MMVGGVSYAQAAGTRLREERLRLAYSQEDFGELGGVRRNTQGNYERGERTPDLEYIAAVAKVGVDVVYVITGLRMLSAFTQLNEHEAQIMRLVHELPKEDQAAIARMAYGLHATLMKTSEATDSSAAD